jgi:membrane protease YdiL (CAAX protease family)
MVNSVITQDQEFWGIIAAIVASAINLAAGYQSWQQQRRGSAFGWWLFSAVLLLISLLDPISSDDWRATAIILAVAVFEGLLIRGWVLKTLTRRSSGRAPH